MCKYNIMCLPPRVNVISIIIIKHVGHVATRLVSDL